LAAEAFYLAGDSSRFPELLDEGLLPWRPFRLFQSRGFSSSSTLSGGVRIDLGVFDPLLGETYAEFGARARSLHRSQGMNVLPRPGSSFTSFVLAGSTVDSSEVENSFFDQIDVTLQGITQFEPGLEASVSLLEGYVDWAVDSFARTDYGASAKAVMAGLEFVRTMKKSSTDPEALFILGKKEWDFLEAARKAHFLFFDALAQGTSDGVVVAGEEFEVEVLFENRSDQNVKTETVELLAPPDWEVSFERARGISTIFTVKVPEKASYSTQFWYRDDPSVDRFSVMDGYTGIETFPPPPLRARVTYRSFGVQASVEQPVHYRWFDIEYGRERRMELNVVPKISVSIEPRLAVLKMGQVEPASFEVAVQNLSPEGMEASLKLEAPPGWRIEPPTVKLSLQGSIRTARKRFSVRPPSRLRPGKVNVRAIVSASEGSTFDSGFVSIAYSHIATHHFYTPALSDLLVLDVSFPSNLKVGYVMGVGDDVALATEQLGASVTFLEEEDLRSGNLDRFDVIITGVRAYLVRQDLIENNQRLLEYVRRGGHMLVQYNKYEFLAEQFAPYAVHINRPHDRVTVEDSPVKILQPEHILFTRPNKITDKDFADWVQERGLYFLGDWDSQFVPLLELRDPWPYNDSPKRGSLVFGEYGDGTYVYTGLAFFRQLRAGVPGAYRLWANLVSLGKLRKNP
jgi:hypothetical protein